MAKRNDITIEICMGLPGSGKTTFAKSREHPGVKVYHLDKMMCLNNCSSGMKTKIQRNIYDDIANDMRYLYESVKMVVFDGLFLTNQDVYDMIIAIHDCFNEIKLDIHYWKEDRETCLKNDGGRREVSSVTTILNAHYEYPDKEWLESQLNGLNVSINRIIAHNVVLKEDWLRYFRGKMFVAADGKLKSKRWCGGGTYGDCWSDTLSPISADKAHDFEELDALLSEICPYLTFLHYKKLTRECVTQESCYERDYYGGGVTYLYWVCDLKKMYEILSQLGYNVKPE